MSLPKLILGAGGHAKVVAEILNLEQSKIVGCVDNGAGNSEFRILGSPILGGDQVLDNYSHDSVLLVNGIGTAIDTELRTQVFKKFKERGYQFYSAVHPSATVGSETSLGEGVQIMAGAVIQPGCRIGDNAVINTRASIDHDCTIESHAHIAPGAVLCGGVHAGEGAFIGAGATVIQGIKLEAGCVIGAGAVVLQNVAKDERVAGVPGRTIESRT
jgi:sugar O-acyltransferase (sialic acid O-acetyltransferase NeuD family)